MDKYEQCDIQSEQFNGTDLTGLSNPGSPSLTETEPDNFFFLLQPNVDPSDVVSDSSPARGQKFICFGFSIGLSIYEEEETVWAS